MKLKAMVAIAMSTVLSFPVMAQRLNTYGGGACGNWVNASQARKNLLQQWLLGYTSGLNSLFYETDPLGKVSSTDQIFVWTDKCCREKPLDTIADAAFSLLKAVQESR